MMQWGFNEHRRRRQRLARVVRVAVVIGLIVAALIGSYRFGVHVDEVRIAQLEAQLDTVTSRSDRLDAERAAIEAELVTVRARLAEVERQYAQSIPNTTQRDLLEKINARLEAGVHPDRLAAVIAVTENERQCEPPVNRRFVVRTPITRPSAGDSLSFADGQITLTGQGISARDEAGNPEAWFDPAQPLSLRFAVLGGQSTQAEGKLPLRHSVILGDWEYRFTIQPSTRGVASVNADRCRYP